jgi:DNA-directed RNA polymerase subunit beta'
MKLRSFDVDKMAKNLPEVSFSKILENRKYSKEGLFSQQIFGPIKSYTCGCSKNSYKGIRYEHEKCPICGVSVTSSEIRKKKYAKIELPFPILNPLFYYIFIGRKSTNRTVLTDLLYYKHEYIINDDNTVERYNPADGRIDGVNYLKGLDGAIAFINHTIDIHVKYCKEKNKEMNPEYKYILDNSEKMVINNIIVMPPGFRPCEKLKSGEYVTDDINKLFQEMLKITSGLKSVPYNVPNKETIYTVNFYHIQKMAIELYDYVLGRMSKKTGLIRANILGKRVDFSGRAVITPDATLKMNECRLPYWMVLEMFKPQLIAHFINRRICKRTNEAIRYIDESIQNRDSKYFDVVKEFCKDKTCVLNRQPTLHRLSMLAFNIDIHLGNTIQIHPLVCAPYNADFDGDALACYFGITEQSIEDIKEHVGIWNNLISPTDMTSVPKPNQDVILGIYAVTKD